MTNNYFIILIIISSSLLLIVLLPYLSWLLEKVLRRIGYREKPKEIIFTISAITDSMIEIAKLGKGAMIVIEQRQNVDKVIFGAELLNAEISKSLLINIFEGSKTPLHDGAVVIRDNKILYAGGFISSLSKKKTDRTYGTRHRSAIGLTEEVDCIVVIVSEERGDVSIVKNGKIEKVSEKEIFEKLSNLLIGYDEYRR